MLLSLAKVMLKVGLNHDFDRYTANILTELSTAFGSVTFPTVIWLYPKLPMAAMNLK